MTDNFSSDWPLSETSVLPARPPHTTASKVEVL